MEREIFFKYRNFNKMNENEQIQMIKNIVRLITLEEKEKLIHESFYFGTNFNEFYVSAIILMYLYFNGENDSRVEFVMMHVFKNPEHIDFAMKYYGIVFSEKSLKKEEFLNVLKRIYKNFEDDYKLNYFGFQNRKYKNRELRFKPNLELSSRINNGTLTSSLKRKERLTGAASIKREKALIEGKNMNLNWILENIEKFEIVPEKLKYIFYREYYFERHPVLNIMHRNAKPPIEELIQKHIIEILPKNMKISMYLDCNVYSIQKSSVILKDIIAKIPVLLSEKNDVNVICFDNFKFRELQFSNNSLINRYENLSDNIQEEYMKNLNVHKEFKKIISEAKNKIEDLKKTLEKETNGMKKNIFIKELKKNERVYYNSVATKKLRLDSVLEKIENDSAERVVLIVGDHFLNINSERLIQIKITGFSKRINIKYENGHYKIAGDINKVVHFLIELYGNQVDKNIEKYFDKKFKEYNEKDTIKTYPILKDNKLKNIVPMIEKKSILEYI